MNCGVAEEFRASAARGARSRFHSLTFQTQRLDAISGPHSQHGKGSSVPFFVYVHEFGRDEFIEHSAWLEIPALGA